MEENENIQKIKMISQFLGQKMPQESELLKMIETAKKMQQIFGEQQSIHTEKKEPFSKTKNILSKEESKLFARTKEENMIYASIPFLDREYQKYLYVVVILLEMKRVLHEDWNTALEARSRKKEDSKIRRKNLLQAVRPYLTNEERQKIDFVVKAMDIKNIMEWKEESL